MRKQRGIYSRAATFGYMSRRRMVTWAAHPVVNIVYLGSLTSINQGETLPLCPSTMRLRLGQGMGFA